MRRIALASFDEFKDRNITDWKRVRGALEHENLLIDQRFTWLLVTQGFLFTATGAIYKSYIDTKPNRTDVLHQPEFLLVLIANRTDVLHQHEFLLVLIAVLAMVLCVFLWRGMAAARLQHGVLANWWREQEKLELGKHPSISGDEPKLGVTLHYHYLPVVFYVTWLGILWIESSTFQSRLRYIAPAGLVVTIVVAAVRRIRFLIKKKGQ